MQRFLSIKAFRKMWLRRGGRAILFAGLTALSSLPSGGAEERVFYRSDAFTVYAASVEREGKKAYIDPRGGGIVSDGSFRFGKQMQRPATWELKRDLSMYPTVWSGYPIIDKVYELALANVLTNIDYAWPDARTVGLFNASEGRPPWVRDTAYAVMGTLPVFPEPSRKTLEWCLIPGESIKPEQMYGVHLVDYDNPTVGSEYSLTDFVIWIEAAWQYAQATGDREFIKKHYAEMVNSAAMVRALHWDAYDGLYHGGDTIADGGSLVPENLAGHAALKGSSVNFIHYRTLMDLAAMAQWIGRPEEESQRFYGWAFALKDAVNRELWLPGQGCFSLVKVDREGAARERSSLAGNSFALWWNGLAGPEKASSIMRGVKDTPWGAPLAYPSFLNRGGYHDQMVWPVMEGLWGVANADAEHPERLVKSLALLTMDGAFHQTMSEYWGMYDGTARGKYPQLWSCTAYVMDLFQGLLGLKFEAQGVTVQPSVPTEFAMGFEIGNMRLGKGVWNFKVHGKGTRIAGFEVDGKPCLNILPLDLPGGHQVRIEMAENLPFETKMAPEVVSVEEGRPLVLKVAAHEGLELALYALGRPDLPMRQFTVEGGEARIDVAALLKGREGVVRYCLVARDNKTGRIAMDRWRYLEVRPALEAHWTPGIFDNTRPLGVGAISSQKLVIENRADRERKVNVSVSAPAGIKLEPSEANLSIPAHSSGSVRVNWETTESLAYGDHAITAQIGDPTNPATPVQSEFLVQIREKIDLRGLWLMHEDANDLRGADPEINDRDGVWKVARMPRRWPQVAGFEKSAGPVWFRRHVLIPTEWKGYDAELFFGEIDGTPEVYLDGKPLSRIPSRRGSFAYHVPADLLLPGENVLVAIKIRQGANVNRSGLCGWPMELRLLPERLDISQKDKMVPVW
jgi:hypothetical protein